MTPVLVAHGGNHDAFAGARVDESVAVEVDAHVVDLPETAKENDIALFQTPAADFCTAAVLEYSRGNSNS